MIMPLQARSDEPVSAATVRIDVLIPVFNAEATLEEAIRSIQCQTIHNIRIIVIDDGSTDGSPAKLAKLSQQDSRIEVITRANSGIVDALNDGLTPCSADYVARHDADDVAYPNRFADQIAYLEAHPRCVAVDGSHHNIDAQGRVTGKHVQEGGAVLPNASAVPSRQPYLTHPFLMVRRAAIERAGGYRHALHAEDTDLYWRLLAIGDLHHMSEMVGAYRLHAGSISSASVLNGRIAATCSQLAALAYRRRLAGQPEPVISRERSSAFQAARSLSAIMQEAGQGLAEDERRWLIISVCAHMLEIGAYRPWTLDDEDVGYIRRVMTGHADLMSRKERSSVDRNLAGMAIKLAAGGRIRAAVRLQPPPGLVVMAALKAAKNASAASVFAPQKLAVAHPPPAAPIMPIMHLGKPSIDVIIAAYNAETTLAQAVRSIQNQTVRDIRIIIVNDGSTDGTATILFEMAARDDRIMVIEKPNSGVEDSRNIGLAEGSAPFVAIFDADDISYPDRLAIQMAYLDAHPACVAVDGSHITINARGREIGRHIQAEGVVSADATATPSQQPYLTHTLLMTRREAITQVGGYRHATRSLDTDLYWRLSEIGELHHLSAIVGEYRLHDTSVSSIGVQNGRLAAITSQLAAISHVRRQNGRPDIRFSRELTATLLAQPSLEAMIDRAGQGLDDHEREWLGSAVAAHLLELVAFRPYLPGASDVDFVRRRLIDRRGSIAPLHWTAIAGNIATVAAKLALAGQISLALALRPWPLLLPGRIIRLIKRRWVNSVAAPLRFRSRARFAPDGC